MEVDFGPLCDLALMLYGTALVSERYAGVAAFLEAGGDTGVKRSSNGLRDIGDDERLLPVTRKILNGAGVNCLRSALKSRRKRDCSSTGRIVAVLCDRLLF